MLTLWEAVRLKSIFLTWLSLAPERHYIELMFQELHLWHNNSSLQSWEFLHWNTLRKKQKYCGRRVDLKSAAPLQQSMRLIENHLFFSKNLNVFFHHMITFLAALEITTSSPEWFQCWTKKVQFISLEAGLMIFWCLYWS